MTAPSKSLLSAIARTPTADSALRPPLTRCLSNNSRARFATSSLLPPSRPISLCFSGPGGSPFRATGASRPGDAPSLRANPACCRTPSGTTTGKEAKSVQVQFRRAMEIPEVRVSAAGSPENPKTRMKIYLIGSLGFTLCRGTWFWT